MANKLDWENVPSDRDKSGVALPTHTIWRARVGGGWLVLLSGGESGPKEARSVTFVPGAPSDWP